MPNAGKPKDGRATDKAAPTAKAGGTAPKGRAASKGGRTTPKATKATATGRYTPPIPRTVKVSPKWVPALMFSLLGVGFALIICNYVNVLPGGTSNWYLIVGLVMITAGLITATRLH